MSMKFSEKYFKNKNLNIENVEIKHGDLQILIDYHSFDENQQKRLLSYMKRIKKGTDDGKRK